MKEIFNKKDISKPLFIFTICIVAIAALMSGMVIQAKYGHYYSTTSGESMKETLNDGTKLLMKNYNGNQLKRGDIVSFDLYIDSEKNSAIKRVIGLPNEVIKVKGNQVYINNQLLDEKYAYYSRSSEDNLRLVLKDNEYFVMGDNRCDSIDSRMLGAVPREIITDVLISYKD